MITCCSICDAPMTICHDDMVCTSCGHSYRFRNFPAPVTGAAPSPVVAPVQDFDSPSAVSAFFQETILFVEPSIPPVVFVPSSARDDFDYWHTSRNCAQRVA